MGWCFGFRVYSRLVFLAAVLSLGFRAHFGFRILGFNGKKVAYFCYGIERVDGTNPPY